MIQEIAEKSVKPKIRLKVTEDYKFVSDVVQKNNLNRKVCNNDILFFDIKINDTNQLNSLICMI